MLAVTIHAGMARPARIPERNGEGAAGVGAGDDDSCAEIDLASLAQKQPSANLGGGHAKGQGVEWPRLMQ